MGILQRNHTDNDQRHTHTYLHPEYLKMYVEECAVEQINWCFANSNVLQPVVLRNSLHAATLCKLPMEFVCVSVFVVVSHCSIWTWKYAAKIQSGQKPTNNEIDYIHHNYRNDISHCIFQTAFKLFAQHCLTWTICSMKGTYWLLFKLNVFLYWTNSQEIIHLFMKLLLLNIRWRLQRDMRKKKHRKKHDFNCNDEKCLENE